MADLDLTDEVVAALAARLERAIDKRLGAIERSVDGVGRDLDSVAGQVAFLMRAAGVKSAPEEDPEVAEGPVAQVDEVWQCVKCGQRLGFYDPSNDLLRIRHKDLTVYVEVGVGGVVSVPCRACSELNTVRDDRGSGESAPG